MDKYGHGGKFVEMMAIFGGGVIVGMLIAMIANTDDGSDF